MPAVAGVVLPSGCRFAELRLAGHWLGDAAALRLSPKRGLSVA
jgi:hypothetical protein